MDYGIKALWNGVPRIAGSAFTVKCEPGDNLALHAALYKAPPGSVIVVDAGSNHFAVAGGNVCATAAARGISGFIIEGVIRDIAEIREMKFPVFARGITPKPGIKSNPGHIEIPIICGGVSVNSGDIIVADEDGVVAIPLNVSEEILEKTRKKVSFEDKQPLSDWQTEHVKKITSILNNLEKEKMS